jgi:hypothetical protein
MYGGLDMDLDATKGQEPGVTRRRRQNRATDAFMPTDTDLLCPDSLPDPREFVSRLATIWSSSRMHRLGATGNRGRNLPGCRSFS